MEEVDRIASVPGMQPIVRWSRSASPRLWSISVASNIPSPKKFRNDDFPFTVQRRSIPPGPCRDGTPARPYTAANMAIQHATSRWPSALLPGKRCPCTARRHKDTLECLSFHLAELSSWSRTRRPEPNSYATLPRSMRLTTKSEIVYTGGVAERKRHDAPAAARRHRSDSEHTAVETAARNPSKAPASDFAWTKSTGLPVSLTSFQTM